MIRSLRIWWQHRVIKACGPRLWRVLAQEIPEPLASQAYMFAVWSGALTPKSFFRSAYNYLKEKGAIHENQEPGSCWGWSTGDDSAQAAPDAEHLK